MTRPGIEPKSSRPLANTRPMSRTVFNCVSLPYHDTTYIIIPYGIILNCSVVSLFRYPLLSPVQVISWTSSIVCCSKYPYNCFSFNFCSVDFVAFLFVLKLFLLVTWSLAALMNLFTYSSNPWIVASMHSSMLVSHLTPFLDTKSLFTPSLGWKTTTTTTTADDAAAAFKFFLLIINKYDYLK